MLESIASKFMMNPIISPRAKRFSFGKPERQSSSDTASTASLRKSPSSLSLSSMESKNKRRTVRFSDACIYEFPTIPGGNTVASISGPPIALGYLTNDDDSNASLPQSPTTTSSSPASPPSSRPTRVMIVAVSDMERYQRLHSRYRYRPLSDRRRRDLLANNGHSEKDIQKAVTQATFVKQQRLETRLLDKLATLMQGNGAQQQSTAPAKKTMDDATSTLSASSSKQTQQPAVADGVSLDCSNLNLALSAVKIPRWDKQAFATACPRSALVIS